MLLILMFTVGFDRIWHVSYSDEYFNIYFWDIHIMDLNKTFFTISQKMFQTPEKLRFTDVEQFEEQNCFDNIFPVWSVWRKMSFP